MLPYIKRVVKKYKKTLNVCKLYTTAEAARLAGISRQTLQVWIVSGKIKPPEVQRPSRLRLWTSQDVTQLKQVKRKRFRRKPGRKPKEEDGASRAVNAST